MVFAKDLLLMMQKGTVWQMGHALPSEVKLVLLIVTVKIPLQAYAKMVNVSLFWGRIV